MSDYETLVLEALSRMSDYSDLPQDWFDIFWRNFVGRLDDILPVLPANAIAVPEAISRYMAWVNWFIPVNLMLNTFYGVVICIVSYVAVRAILRTMRVL